MAESYLLIVDLTICSLVHRVLNILEEIAHVDKIDIHCIPRQRSYIRIGRHDIYEEDYSRAEQYIVDSLLCNNRYTIHTHVQGLSSYSQRAAIHSFASVSRVLNWSSSPTTKKSRPWMKCSLLWVMLPTIWCGTSIAKGTRRVSYNRVLSIIDHKPLVDL